MYPEIRASAEVRGLEHRHEPTETATELIVEARKPGIPAA